MKEVKNKKMYQGSVISDKMEKTIIVEYERVYEHRQTKKIMRSAKKYKVHDEQEQAKIGDLVEFYEGRPISKTKYMYLARVINK